MSVYVRKYTSGTRPSSTTYTSPYTDSSAKKYVTNNSVQNNSPTDSVSNVEHIVTLAAGMKSLSLSVAAIAQDARSKIGTAVSNVMQVDGVSDPLSRAPMIQYSEQDVNQIQRSIAAIASKYYSSAENATIRSQLMRQAENFVLDSRHAFIPNRMENMTVATSNNAVPQIESVTVDISKNVGAIDNFYAGILFNIPVSASANVQLIRIFRATVSNPVYTRPLNVISSNGMQRLQSYRGAKAQDPVAATVLRMDEANIPNAVSLLNYINPFTGQRVSAVGDASLLIPPPLPNQKQAVSLSIDNLPPALSHIDKSVAENINVIYNLQNNPILNVGSVEIKRSDVVGGDRSTETFSPVVIDESNKLEFREIAKFTPGGLTTKKVGNMVEYYYEDNTVSYGGGYKYFIVTVDKSAVQSPRSSVVNVVVEGLRVPPRPLNVSTLIDKRSITLSMTSTDQLVEKFEVYRKDENIFAAQRAIAQVISDQEGYTVSAATRDIGSNDYLLIGEALNSVKTGGSFMDINAIPGRPYTYRVYAVDIFGNKSESPFEVDAYIPDLNQQYVSLQSPSLLAEVDATTHKMKLTFNCIDPLVEKLTLERRDLTIGEEAFTIPTTPSRVVFGYGRSPVKNRPSMLGERLFNNSLVDTWTGRFVNTQAQQTFVDNTVQYDHIYQYRIYGEDRYGNKTSYTLSSPLMIIRRPFVNPPVSLKAEVKLNDDDTINGVSISWALGSLDVSAGDKLGSQNALSDSSVRTLYQLQRRVEGDDKWRSFPLTSATTVLDPIDQGDAPPNFRPPYVSTNTLYHYRVQAIQTGSYISNFTAPVSVFVGYNVGSPINFSLMTPSVTTSPFYVMLNWDMPSKTGIVDRWEIERAVTSNIASAQLNMKSAEALSKLTYTPHRTVYRESSRFASKDTDANAGAAASSVINGTYYFMDTQVDFGNSYFYRMRSISPEGQTSKWVYRGIKLTSTVFEQKYMPTISDEEKQSLISTGNPLVMVQVEKSPASSYSMQPNFSRPWSTSIRQWWLQHMSSEETE